MKKERVVGIIGDTHIPYEHPGYLDHCVDNFRANGVTDVIHIGDLVDHHALSFHKSEPALKGANGEHVDSLERLKPWKKAFPKMQITHGNHDKIPARQLKEINMDPSVFMRPIADVYRFPVGWREVERVFLDGVLYHHGETAVADFGYGKDARERMVNTVTGHAHGNFGVAYTATEHRMVFGMGVGCGIDRKALAFVYGKNFKKKPIVGCGIVAENGRFPFVIPMDLGEKP